MLSPELCKKLKEAGLSDNAFYHTNCSNDMGDDWCCKCDNIDNKLCFPSLSELIEACKTDFLSLNFAHQESEARFSKLGNDGKYHIINSGWYKTLEEAVANLYLKIHKNKSMHKFIIGDKVNKKEGYEFPGTIVSVFMTTKGKERIVVEMDKYGLLHIFNPDQLIHQF